MKKLLLLLALVASGAASFFYVRWQHEVNDRHADEQRAQVELGRLATQTQQVKAQLVSDSTALDSLNKTLATEKSASSDAWAQVTRLRQERDQAVRSTPVIIGQRPNLVELHSYDLAVDQARRADSLVIAQQGSVIRKQQGTIKAQAELLSTQGKLLGTRSYTSKTPKQAQWSVLAGVLKASDRKAFEAAGRVGYKLLGPVYAEVGLQAPLSSTVQWRDVRAQGGVMVHF